MAFRRFTSLRGNPNNCWSDCGTNFIGAQHYLKEITQEWDIPKIQSAVCEELSCTFHWNWNVPRASHQNGVVESLIKSVRRALEVSSKTQVLTEEQWSHLPRKSATTLSQFEWYLGRSTCHAQRPFDRKSFSTSCARRAIKGETKGSR